MDVYVPILGLQHLNLEPIQLLEIRNFDAPGTSTLPPATNVNLAISDLLLKIDTIYAARKKKDIKNRKTLDAVFKFPDLNEPGIFRGSNMMQSIGLGLLVKAYASAKKNKYTSRFDLVCVTGVLAKNISDKDIYQGNFLSASTGDIEEKLKYFIAFIKQQNFRQERIAFIYCGGNTDEISANTLDDAHSNNIEIKKSCNFAQLLEYLFKKTSGISFAGMMLVAGFVLFLTLGIFFLVFIIFHKDPCLSLFDAIKEKNTIRIRQQLDDCGNANIKDTENKTLLMYAVQNEDSETARLLIDAGADVNVIACKGENKKIQFLEKVCACSISPFPVSGYLEESARFWGVSWGDSRDNEYRLPVFNKADVVLSSRGSGEEKILKLSLNGGEPYAFAHFYMNLAPDDAARRFYFSGKLQLIRETTFNNVIDDSIVQAIEISVSRFSRNSRYELAYQLENVEDNQGDGAPQWRYWDVRKGWVSTGIKYEIKPKVWHEISFDGDMTNGFTYYRSFTIDGQKYEIQKVTIPRTLSHSLEYLSVAFQLDGNKNVDQFEICVKDVMLKKD